MRIDPIAICEDCQQVMSAHTWDGARKRCPAASPAWEQRCLCGHHKDYHHDGFGRCPVATSHPNIDCGCPVFAPESSVPSPVQDEPITRLNCGCFRNNVDGFISLCGGHTSGAWSRALSIRDGLPLPVEQVFTVTQVREAVEVVFAPVSESVVKDVLYYLDTLARYEGEKK